MSLVDRARARLAREPTFYGRMWTVSINLVGAVVIAAVLLDADLMLGAGRTGVFRRALYPLAPPALTLGVAVAQRQRRGVALSGGLLVAYVLVLWLVGTLGSALAVAPGYVAAGGTGVAGLTAVGWLLGRRRERVRPA